MNDAMFAILSNANSLQSCALLQIFQARKIVNGNVKYRILLYNICHRNVVVKEINLVIEFFYSFLYYIFVLLLTSVFPRKALRIDRRK